MNDQNPYKTPEADLVKEGAAAEPNELLDQPNKCQAAAGWEWIAESFSLFTKNPGIWILIALLYFLIMIAFGFIPLLGVLASNLLNPVFFGGIFLGCYALTKDEPLEVNHLFAGFKVNNTGSLIGIGGLYLVGGIIVIIIAFVPMFLFGLGGALLFDEAGGPEAAMLGIGFLLVFLVVLALSLPLIMAYWFAPVLVVMHNVNAIEAMKLSFKGCLRNIVPFLVYGLIMMLFSVIAVIPLGLGLLVLIPILWCSTYIAYKHIYLANNG